VTVTIRVGLSVEVAVSRVVLVNPFVAVNGIVTTTVMDVPPFGGSVTVVVLTVVVKPFVTVCVRVNVSVKFPVLVI
jgi:hypothetical protein